MYSEYVGLDEGREKIIRLRGWNDTGGVRIKIFAGLWLLLKKQSEKKLLWVNTFFVSE